MYDKNRIESLRLDALEPRIDYTPFYYHFQKAYIARRGEVSSYCRFALSLADAFEKWGVAIAPGELIVGRPSEELLTEEERAEWALISRYAMGEQHVPVGQDSHMAFDYDRLLTMGTTGIKAMIDQKIAALPAGDPLTVKKADWYRSCRICMDALERFSERYAQKAEELAAAETDPAQKAEYETIAAICRKVPKYPASSFYEAVQSTAFVTFAMSVKPLRPSMLQYQLGRPDRYLYPYYKADVEAGVLCDDFAQTLIDCLCIQINRRVPSGLSSGFMVGGRAPDGTPVSNPITRMCMNAIRHNRLVYPSLGLCHCSDTPKGDLDLACAILAEGHSHPAIFNDDVIAAGLRYYGLTPEEACSYIHSTCVEITPCSSSNVWVASPYTNLPGELVAVLNSDDFTDMNALYKAYKDHILQKIRNDSNYQILCRYERARYCPDPFLSCLVKDCLETGTDIEEGGARYNWIMPSFVGLANAADGLAAIRKLVFEEGFVTLDEYKAALQDNFSSHPALYARIRELPGYGNNGIAEGNPEWYVNNLSSWIADACENFTVPFSSGRLIPSLFCWVMHDRFGQVTGATPDGRLAGFPLGDGSGPAQGREMEGPTTSLLSSTCWDHTRFIGGIAVNMKFSASLLGEHSTDMLSTLIGTYLDRGGFEIQINVTDNRILEDARLHPENYRDLVVRIGGYSDYFTRLSPTMQEEVIRRTTHTL
ncbi:MAG: hypothetical protein E7631_03390 [Ruminococcaceae bacterium]|nr:hypothetical protein [Oscillospiraceae bacterium]